MSPATTAARDSRILDPVRWLSLDVGAQRVGVAVCDAGEEVVTPSSTLPFRDPRTLAAAVAILVRERGIEGVVVGVPVTRSGEGRGERRVRSVIDELRVALTIPVEECDERGTTAAASERLRDAGVPARRQRALIDAVAAAVILEGFLALRRRPHALR